jgi:tRNA A37 threonylcarbamoyltransferase TsaD
LEKAIPEVGVKLLLCGGGVLANKRLREMIRGAAKEEKIAVWFPPAKKLIGDNAGMIGVAGCFKYQKGVFLKDNFTRLDRVARPDLKMWI